MITGIWRCK